MDVTELGGGSLTEIPTPGAHFLRIHKDQELAVWELVTSNFLAKEAELIAVRAERKNVTMNDE